MMKLNSMSGCTRPGKLRFPDRMATALLLPLFWARTIGSVSGPGLPMQVVHPKPTIPKPTASRSSNSPARCKYEAAAGDPGANEVLTQCGAFSPSLRALRASNPAAIKSAGSEVLVQLVMAAIATG